ncbi:MAG: glutamate-5-semialdehyde dehydrogenase [Saprospiraceae bacterium]|nr:glutamate-5-semialdehyde dehydrogenase [Saprospiraceae bacterium]
MESILPLLEQTHLAASAVRALTDTQKQALLLRIADLVLENQAIILAENQKDAEKMAENDPKKDRLLLHEKRLIDLAQSIREVAALPDPSGEILLERTLPNGIHLRKIAVPLGVVGIIYESRPNVTLDVSALCLRSGNAVALRGGSEAIHSNLALVAVIHQALDEWAIPRAAVTLLPTDRALMHELLTATRYVDIIIPRGSDALIKFVRKNATVPTIETGAGVCHTYVHRAADLDKAQAIVVNAKVSRPSVCNSLDTVLVDREIAEQFLSMLQADFYKWQVTVLAYETVFPILEKAGWKRLQMAQTEDFGREFLDYKCSIKVVENLDAALEHIRQYSSRHSEAIISEDAAVCQQFIERVDAAVVYANASTRFTDGGEFGLGAEIGISTQKLHARGPFALEKLVTEKWIAVGDGQVRW